MHARILLVPRAFEQAKQKRHPSRGGAKFNDP